MTSFGFSALNDMAVANTAFLSLNPQVTVAELEAHYVHLEACNLGEIGYALSGDKLATLEH